jgi:Fic family protein
MINKAIQLNHELDKLRPISPEMEQRIMQKFRLDWNYHSNNLEGNSLTYGETKALILFGITANGKPLKDHAEVIGHDEAIKWILEIIREDRPLNEMFIRELHVLILKNPYEVKAITPEGNPTTKLIKIGTYKTSPNHVKTKTGEIFYFATPEETPAKMADLVKWYRNEAEKDDVNPILLAAQFHYRFIIIHPFDDGNGRTARILMNFILMQFNYPPVIIKTEDKENYFAALRQADAGMFEPFANYIAENLVHSLEIMLKGAKGESIDKPDDIDKEIALLKASLNNKMQKKEKNEDTVATTIDLIVIPLFKKLLTKSNSLKSLFKSTKPLIRFNGKEVEIRQLTLNDFKNTDIDLTIANTCSFRYDWDILLAADNVNSFRLNLEINFNYFQYEIPFFNIKKYYTETLDETEINYIVNTLIRNVIQEIKEATK